MQQYPFFIFIAVCSKRLLSCGAENVCAGEETFGSNFWCREHETRRLGIIRKFSPNTEEIRLGSHTLMAARLVLSANNTVLCSPAAHLPLFQKLLSLFLFCMCALGY